MKGDILRKKLQTEKGGHHGKENADVGESS